VPAAVVIPEQYDQCASAHYCTPAMAAASAAETVSTQQLGHADASCEGFSRCSHAWQHIIMLQPTCMQLSVSGFLVATRSRPVTELSTALKPSGQCWDECLH